MTPFKPIKKIKMIDEMPKLIEDVFNLIKEKYGNTCSKVISDGIIYPPEQKFVHQFQNNTYYVATCEEDELIGLFVLDQYQNVLEAKNDRAELIAICKDILKKNKK